MVVRTELQLAADAVELGKLRLVKRRCGRFEDCARVSHRLVEHQTEEVVADVIVRGDPPARALGVFRAHQLSAACGPATTGRTARRQRSSAGMLSAARRASSGSSAQSNHPSV